MRRSAFVLPALLATLGVATVAGAAPADRSVVSPGPVSAVARSRLSVAFATQRTARACEGVRLWSLATRAVRTLGRPRPCDETSTGRGIAGLANAQGRVLWVTFAGGNDRDWELWTASDTARTPRRLRFVTVDVDEPQPVVVGAGDAYLLAYAVEDELTVLGVDGSRQFRWTAPGPIAAVVTGNNRVGVLLRSGPVVVLSRTGTELARFDYPAGGVRALELGLPGAVVQLESGTIETRRLGSTHRWQLPPDARMLDFAAGVVLYSRGNQLRSLHVNSRADRLVRVTTTPVLASLDPSGLAYVHGQSVIAAGISRLNAG
jgi:hypothetical protein